MPSILAPLPWIVGYPPLDKWVCLQASLYPRPVTWVGRLSWGPHTHSALQGRWPANLSSGVGRLLAGWLFCRQHYWCLLLTGCWGAPPWGVAHGRHPHWAAPRHNTNWVHWRPRWSVAWLLPLQWRPWPDMGSAIWWKGHTPCLMLPHLCRNKYVGNVTMDFFLHLPKPPGWGGRRVLSRLWRPNVNAPVVDRCPSAPRWKHRSPPTGWSPWRRTKSHSLDCICYERIQLVKS